MKSFIFLLIFTFFFFVNCSDEIPEFEQIVTNNSNYTCYINFYGTSYKLTSGESRTISKELHISDEYESAELSEEGFPRVQMTKTLLKSKSYKYTIENLTGIDCKIVNTSNYEIFISHNYLGENYSEGIYCPKNQTTETKIYKNYNSGFTAIYKNHSTITDTLEADLQNSKCKSVSISQLKDDNNIYLVINIE